MSREPTGPISDLPTIVHITHWKAGSQWIFRILNECCPERIITPETDGEHFLNAPVFPGKIYPTVYLPKQTIDDLTLPADTRFFVILRDPRDTLVSLYFSYKVSHVLEKNVTLPDRQHLQLISEEDGLLEILERDIMRDILDIHTSWAHSGATVLSYEDLIERDEELLVPLLTRICPLDVDESMLRAAIRRNRFEVVSGRALGVENVQSHLRFGQPGNWRKHFTPKVAEAFENRFGPQMRQLGYVQDSTWILEAGARGRTRQPDAAPRLRSFSVIMSLPGHGGHAIPAIDSWIASMRYPDAPYELIVVSNGESPRLDKDLRARLRACDQLLVVPGANRSVLINRGVQASSFDQLVFTEAHAEAKPDFLTALNDWLSAHPDIDAVCGHTMAASENNFAYWDGRLHDESFASHREGNEWWNINIHSFSLPRESFHRGGGLDESYDLFAVVLLAARLRALGLKIGYAAGPAVIHHNRPTLGEVSRQTRAFIRDEYHYRRANPGPDRLGFSALPSLPEVVAIQEKPWPRLLRSALKRLGPQNARLVATLLGHAVLELAGASVWAKTRPARQLAWSQLACFALQKNRSRLEPHYRSFRRLIAIEELHALHHADPRQRIRPLTITPGESATVANADASVWGLHANELYQEIPFRWTRPLSIWHFAPPPGKQITLNLLPVRGDILASDIKIYWDGARIARHAITWQPDSLVLRLPKTASSADLHTLVVQVPRLKTSRASRQLDPRALGLPVTHVTTAD